VTKAPWCVAFGEAFAVLVEDERVVPVVGRREVEECLEQAVDVGRLEEVAAAGHEVDTLEGVVHDDAEMVAGGGLFARQDDVAEDLGPCRLGPCIEVVPSERARAAECGRNVQAERVWVALLGPPFSFFC
jgi:hypothetical protein